MTLSPDMLSKLDQRIDELRQLGSKEGSPLNEASYQAARIFIANHAERRPSAFLLGNGNIRLLWMSLDSEAQIGLQFHEDGVIQHVIFTKFGSSAGRGTIHDILKLIEQHNLTELL